MSETGYKNKVAKTPPMGWNSWDCYGASVTEDILMGNARYMADKLLKYGWEYIVCDIQWYEPNARGTVYKDFAPLSVDSLSRVTPAVNRFPSAANGVGFRSIAERIHSMGLKFGVHIMRGIPRQAVDAKTPIAKGNLTAADIADRNSYCKWNTDMYGVNPDADGAYEYYLSLYTLFAEWGVDYVKVDDICKVELFADKEPYAAKGEIELIRKAIDNCGRPMVLSLSPGDASVSNVEHMKANANMWRMTGDVWDKWYDIERMFDYCKRWYPYVCEHAWPDCDMLPLGRICIHETRADANRLTRLTLDEQRMMLSLWCIFRSPLMLGCELTDDRPEILELTTNADILKMHREGREQHPVDSKKHIRIWTSHTDDGTVYVAVFNIGKRKKHVSVTLDEVGVEGDATEVWSNTTYTSKKGTLSVKIPAHVALVFKFSAKK